MTRAVSFRLLFSVIPEHFFCHSEPERGIRSWMLRCAQHDRMGTANLTLLSLSFARRGDGNLTLSLCDVPLLRNERDVLAKAKTGRGRTVFQALFCHSEHFLLSFQVLFFVIPNASEESAHGCFAALSMTEPKASFRTPVRNPLMDASLRSA